MAAPVLIASDLHLDPRRPETLALFQQFLDGPAQEASDLYLLGDVFEVWFGDDAIHPAYQPLLEGLAALARNGVGIHLQHGNRDFLMGRELARMTGADLLPETTVVELAGEPTLLLHGDALCTDDVEHQAFRAMVLDPQWQAGFLTLSVEERAEQARQAREKSRAGHAEKSDAIMDVNGEAVADAFRSHGVRRMIHGHTHRPAVHDHAVDGAPCRRMVLPQWHTSGGYIRCDGDGCELLPFPSGTTFHGPESPY